MLRQRAIPLILATKPHKVGNGVRRLARQKMRWTFYGVKAALKPRTKKRREACRLVKLLKVCAQFDLGRWTWVCIHHCKRSPQVF